MSFLIVAPQSSEYAGPEATRRLKRALTELRMDGIDAHGQVVHPDPFTATMEALHDERVDEVIVSTFPSARSGWLRRDLIERLARRDRAVPIDARRFRGRWRMSAHAEPVGHGHAPPRERERASAADPLQLADLPADRRDLPLHRVGDHALRLVLHRVFLRPRRQQRIAVAALHPRHAHPVRAALVPRPDQHVHPGHVQLHHALGDASRSSAAIAPASAPAWCSRSCSARPSCSRR